MSLLETLHIEYLKTIDVIPYARNSRTHSDEQVAGIMGSIKEFGFTNPVLLGKDNVLIAGHGRLLAAQRLGMQKVPVIRLEHLDEHQQRALVIADNKLALNAGWDEQLLQSEINALSEYCPKLLDVTGFDDVELEELMQWTGLEEGDNKSTSVASDASDEAVPDVEEKAISQLGELWLLGKHRLLVGSATESANYPILMDGEQAAMCFTDPPYNIDYTGKTDKKMKIKNDKLGGGFHHFLFQACQQILRYTEGGVYICMSSSELHTLSSAFIAAGGKWSTFIIWMKNHFTMGRADYQRQYEPILYGWRQNGERYWCGDRNQTDIWQYDRPVKNDLHPTMKPVALVKKAIENTSKQGDLVLDPFGGSGSTLIAAEQTGRRVVLMEIDPIYADVIIRRWQQETGQEAKRLSDSQLFNQLSLAA